MPKVPPADAGANLRNLARLNLLRSVLLLALLLAAALTALLQDVPLHRDGGLQLALLLFVAMIVWTLRRLRSGAPVSEAELCVQLVVDVLLVTLVLYRTGGATNPFVSYYLVPLTIAAATLRAGFAVVLALLTLWAYTLLLYRYVPFGPFAMAGMAELAPADPHAGHGMALHTAGQGFNLHVFGMWLNFLLSAGLILFFVSRMSRALREQDRRLALQHEHLLQREQVLALGALAAGAAHELGTPLATMSVIARELENGLPADSPLHEDAVLLRRQLAHCREILQGLRARAAGALPRQPLSMLLQESVSRMEVMYPQRRFRVQITASVCTVLPPPTLPQVLTNLIDNAAQAARSEVNIHWRAEGGDLVLDIRDDGEGVAPEVAARLGQPFVSGREDGLGLGYFLSHASVNQWGGSIRLQPEAAGTLTRLRLPLSLLQPEVLPLDEAPA
jgi:two-component system sensor histidine kinase RegB